jgi:2-polyprenyl-3-methyl-5-hydroxy-6-metoxy-1,4-benzoquinol methylase
MAKNYRERVYESYASHFQLSETKFDIMAARMWARPYTYYFRNWLPLNKHAAIADVACGQGRLLQFFIDKGYRDVSGVDVSEQQVIIAKQVADNVEQNEAINWLSEKENSFDTITCIDIIEHFDKSDLFVFLDYCFLSLKPGGRLIIQTPNAASLFSSTVRYGDFTHEICFTPNLLRRILELCGFHNCEVREVGPVLKGQSFRSFVRAVLWRLLRLGLMSWNLIETGSRGENVFTRVFLISAIRPGEKS